MHLVLYKGNVELDENQIELQEVENVTTRIRNSIHRINSILARAKERPRELKENLKKLSIMRPIESHNSKDDHVLAVQRTLR